MLIHLIPKLYLGHRKETPNCELIDLAIAELDLVLTGNKDIATRRPYPNKRLLVGCRKLGRKAIDGIFIETKQHVHSFTAVTRWAVDAVEVITHQTNYIVLDEDFDTVSADMSLWYGSSGELGNWKSRCPDCAVGTPVSLQPRMDIWTEKMGGAVREGETNDIIGASGLIIKRTETFRVPTIERERLLGERAKFDRFPSLESAFLCKVN